MLALRCLLAAISLVLPVTLARKAQVDSILSDPKEHLHNKVHNSSPADTKCPKTEAIAPCSCSTIGTDDYNINCFGNITNADLTRIFSQPFPQLTASTLTINTDSPKLTELGDILVNGVTFWDVSIKARFLEKVSPNFLANSTSTLEYLECFDAKINETTFPFETLGNYPELAGLDFRNNDFIEHLLPLDNPELWDFAMIGLDGPTHLKYLTPGWNKMTPQLTSIDLSGNVIERLEKDTFILTVLENWYSIDLSGNRIEYIDPEAFVFPNASNSTKLALHLGGNRLKTLEEEVFRPILDKIDDSRSRITFGTIWTSFPPTIQCHNCSMKWLFEPRKQNTTYLESFTGTCVEGMKMENLTYAWYGEHCS